MRAFTVLLLIPVLVLPACGVPSNAGSGQQPLPTSTLPFVATSTTISPPTSPEPEKATIEPFTTLAPAGAYPVITLERGESLPRDMPVGRYRFRLWGQQDWPEECLGEVFFAGPGEPLAAGATSGPDEAWDAQAAIDNQRAYMEAYAEFCKEFTSDPAWLDGALTEVPANSKDG
jgi:hypothetical protein